MDELIFVCTGNTCRSPLCEAFFRKQQGETLCHLHASSAGIFTAENLPASDYAQQVALEHGMDLQAHRSRMLTEEMVKKARYLVCMTAAHYDRLCTQFSRYQDKIFMLSTKDIPDPFGGNLEIYRATAKAIEEAVQHLIQGLPTCT